MKTIQQRSFRLSSFAFLFIIGVIVASCKKDSDPISAEGSLTASNEASMASQTDETDDMASSALTTSDQPNGRVASASTDGRFSCATLSFNDTTTSHRTSGSIVIDFGTDGCRDAKGNVRKGKIIITWEGGRWFLAQATYVITFNGYSINDVKFSDGDIRTITNISTISSPFTWTVEASHSLTWPDGSVATRQVHETKQLVLAASFSEDKFIVSQTSGKANAASGTNRHGKEYSVQITTADEYDISCAVLNKVFLPVKGTEMISYDNGKSLTIDFGTGTCDNTYTVTENSHSKVYTADNSSNN